MFSDGLFWVALFVPLVWPFVAKAIWHSTITFAEMATQFVIVVGLVSLMWLAGVSGQTRDTEIWSGQITGKARQEVSCEHSYDCNCRSVQSCSGSGKNRTCSTSQVCDTCYEHSHDVDWFVSTNLPGGNFDVRRIDRQGLDQPPRWSQVKPGQPAAVTKGYVNYIKGAPESLFNLTVNYDQFKNKIPPYPTVYDYHKVNRIIPIGVDIPNVSHWNSVLSDAMKAIGPQKQANVILVAVNSPTRQYRYALENAWLGGKKNDAVIIIGTMDNGKTIDWVEIMSWSKSEIFNVALRDELQNIGTLDDMQKIINRIESNTLAYFKRRPMAEFEYLKDEIRPPEWAQWTIIILGLIISAVLTLVFHKNDVYNQQSRTGYRKVSQYPNRRFSR